MSEIYKLRFPDGKSYVGSAAHCAGKLYMVHLTAANAGLRRSPLYQHWHKFGPPELIILQENVPREELPLALAKTIERHRTLYPAGLNALHNGEMTRDYMRRRKSERIAAGAQFDAKTQAAARKQAYLDRHG